MVFSSIENLLVFLSSGKEASVGETSQNKISPSGTLSKISITDKSPSVIFCYRREKLDGLFSIGKTNYRRDINGFFRQQMGQIEDELVSPTMTQIVGIMAQFEAIHRRLDMMNIATINYQYDFYNGNHPTSKCWQANMISWISTKQYDVKPTGSKGYHNHSCGERRTKRRRNHSYGPQTSNNPIERRGKSIKILYGYGYTQTLPRPWRFESGSIKFILRGFGSGFGSLFHYKGLSLGLEVPRGSGPIYTPIRVVVENQILKMHKPLKEETTLATKSIEENVKKKNFACKGQMMKENLKRRKAMNGGFYLLKHSP
ncbi:hypothetical protein M9H77_04417 [Catharanthus roseus]|uniref:Uncharacterized protein n=1 Tax=Catharanthus roseus TaxID=4058 RepID=A0ACC0CEH5_CATRO|nr:hypothetical protein M9H77_04417 [Catharanthus roseus]